MYRLYQRPNLFNLASFAEAVGQASHLANSTLRKALYRIARVHQESFEIRSLRRLDDRLLRDIGIARADIPSAVKAALDAAEARRAAGLGSARFDEVSLSSLRLKPCVNC